MENLSTHNIFYLLMIIFIIFIVAEKYLDSRHLIAIILVIILLYFTNNYLTTNQQKISKGEESFADYFDIKKYKYIARNEDIYNIYVQLYFLSKYNSVSFKESALYMDKFLEIIYYYNNNLYPKNNNVVNISNTVKNAILYSTESLNILKSIVTSLPIKKGIFSDRINIITYQDPNTEILDRNINILDKYVTSIKEDIIDKINNDSYSTIDIDTGFIDDINAPQENPLNSYSYMSNFNLY